MSRTSQMLVAVVSTALALSLAGCSDDKTDVNPPKKSASSNSADLEIEVCRLADPRIVVTINSSEFDGATYSRDLLACKAKKKSLDAAQRQADEKDRRQYQAAAQKLHSAVARADGRTGKLFAVMNLACRRTYVSRAINPEDSKYLALYSKEYKKHWYPSQAVAFPFDLEGAMQKACPTSFVKLEGGGG